MKKVMLVMVLLCISVWLIGCGPASENSPASGGSEKQGGSDITPEKVPSNEARPSPTGRDEVGVSIYDNLTGKVDDLPNGSEMALGNYASALDLSKSPDREKLIRKWIELVGSEKARRHTVTIWSQGIQYRWPSQT